VSGASIIASRASAAEMAEVTPRLLAAMMRAAPHTGRTGAYLERIFGGFDFERARGQLPDQPLLAR
jgi:hypothetical protein